MKIPYEKYLLLKPSLVEYQNKVQKRKYAVLKPNIWTDIIYDAFLAKYNYLPCNFILKRNKVVLDDSHGKYFLTFSAKCKDKGYYLVGWSKNKPKKGHALHIYIKAEDTRGHELGHTTFKS